MNLTLLNPLRRTWSSFASSRLAVLTQPDKLFLALAVPFGLIFIFLLAPFQAPDEYSHFYQAYGISTGHWTEVNIALPKSVLDFTTTVSKDLPGNDQNKQSKKALVQEFRRPYEKQPQESVYNVNSAIVSPLPYLPQAFGILIGRIIHLNPIFIFYLARLINFMAWLGLTFLAIQITPIHPRLFAALALMPMTIQQAASVSPDAATNAISFLFIALALRVLIDTQPTIQWSDWIKLGLLVIALALCKSIYILAAGLMLAVPLRRFKQQKAVLPLSLGVISLGAAAGLLWLNYSSQLVTVEMMNSIKGPTIGNIGFILQHPAQVAQVFWNSMVVYTGPQMRMFIGVLGWLDTVLPTWVYPVYYALLLFVVIFESHPTAFFYLRERLWLALLAVMNSLIMMAIFFYPDVSIGNGLVLMAQGRYFIPLGLFYFLPFSQRKWSIPADSPVWIVTGLLHALVLIAAIRAILWRYYAI